MSWRWLSALWLLLATPTLAEIPSRPTVAFALEAIRDRALQSTAIDKIGLEGLRGLTALDPALVVRKVEDRIQLTYRDHHLASFALPVGGDIAGWSLLIENASRIAASRSKTIGKADSDALTQTIIDACLSQLDIFSHYAGPAETRERRAARNGFGGIGVRYDLNDDGVRISEVIPDSPAAQAHLKVGDLILAIDEVRLGRRDIGDIMQRMRGPIGSAVKLTLRRPGDAAPLLLTLHRGLIIPPSVFFSQDGGIATITITGFKENTATLAADAIRKAKAMPGFKGLILDLRGNPGGLLDQAVDVADLFVEQGRILTSRGRHPAAAQSQDARPGDIAEDIATVALVDGGTASAAEILAADLQDLGRAVLVGTNSFGKGAIQTVLDLPNHGEMTLTWSRFLAPSGYALHGLGLLPNICVQPADPSGGDSALAGGRAAPRPFFAAWRGAGAEDRPLRARLRRHCPAADHVGDKAELAIARHLLEDRAVFSRALAVARPVATAAANQPSNDLH